MNPAIDERVTRLAVIAAALLYGAAHLAWFGTTPLGAFPVLDGREILELAKQIAAGTVAAEPFYRAPLYPALISVFVWLGVPETALPDAARALNLLAHVVSATLVFELARRLWGNVRAGLLGGLVYALYPVTVDFAGDPLDITLATTLALASTLAAWLAVERGSVRQAAAAAALMALAALARPNFLLCLPGFFLWLGWHSWRDRSHLRLLAAAAVGTFAVLGAMGVVNKVVGDEFRLLPWQGSHGLWDANGPGANGLFYSHTIPIPDLVPGTNPARAEAEILYCRDRPCTGKLDIDDFSSYWRQRFFSYAREQPTAVLGLLVDKVYYLINNYEQYNNKTYWFHKDRAPWLRWNPLCWAWVLALALGALWLPMRPKARQLILVFTVFYAGSLLIYFVSGRFRVPLAGWLCVLAGGWALTLGRGAVSAGWPRWRQAAMLATALGIGGISAIPVAESLRQGTVTEDWALVASASLAAGKWQESEEWALKVVERLPDRTVALALLCSARLYGWEASPSEALPPRAWLEQSLAYCAAGSKGSNRASYNASFFLAGLCQQQQALDVWEQLKDSKLVGELSRNALAAAGRGELRADDAVVGILELQRKPAATLKPGQRSMLAALEGRQCQDGVRADASAQ